MEALQLYDGLLKGRRSVRTSSRFGCHADQKGRVGQTSLHFRAIDAITILFERRIIAPPNQLQIIARPRCDRLASSGDVSRHAVRGLLPRGGGQNERLQVGAIQSIE
jgi:hypothetical protein